MKSFHLLASVAAIVPCAFNNTCEVVNIVGEDGNPVRVNKEDYDADQAEGGAKAMKLHKEDADQPVSGEPVPSETPKGVVPVAAPSAPNFSGGEQAAPPLPIDPVKQAAAPATPAPDQKFVAKEGTGRNAKFHVVNAAGEKITGMAGIEDGGYTSEQDAWAAVMALPR